MIAVSIKGVSCAIAFSVAETLRVSPYGQAAPTRSVRFALTALRSARSLGKLPLYAEDFAKRTAQLQFQFRLKPVL